MLILTSLCGEVGEFIENNFILPAQFSRFSFEEARVECLNGDESGVTSTKVTGGFSTSTATASKLDFKAR